MTRDQIDDLMRDNGIVVVGEAVYALVQLAIEAERQRCAQIAARYHVPMYDGVADAIAAEILAGGQP